MLKLEALFSRRPLTNSTSELGGDRLQDREEIDDSSSVDFVHQSNSHGRENDTL